MFRTGHVLIVALLLCHVAPPLGARTLNNLCAELLNAEGGTPKEKEMKFTNPREGWCFFSMAGGATVKLNDEPSGLFTAAASKPAEAMRYLPAGEHQLVVSEGMPSSLVVRAVPELQYSDFPVTSQLSFFGPFTWEYLERIGLLANLNTMIMRIDNASELEERSQYVQKWTAQGKRAIHHTYVPLSPARVSPAEAAKSYEYWVNEFGMNQPGLVGVIANEFFPHDGIAKYFPHYVEGILRLHKEKPDRLFYLYMAAGFEGPADTTAMAAPLMPLQNIRFAWERYISEAATEADAKRNIKRMLSTYLTDMAKEMPGIEKKSIHALWVCGMPETGDIYPSADFKVLLDMQFHLLANDPKLAGLAGLQLYNSAYYDEEHLRWVSKLIRHYCIEGKTDRLSKDPYMLDHLTNGDFVGGTKGWTVNAAENGTIDTKEQKGYGYTQGRYLLPDPKLGDSFLWTRRSASKPNSVSQEIRNLTPGRVYSLKMYVGQFPDLSMEQKTQAAQVQIDGVEMLPQPSFRETFRSTHHPKYPDEKRFLDYYRYVFRAKSTTAKLTISDWSSPQEPGGPIGQEQMYNFVQVEPFFNED